MRLGLAMGLACFAAVAAGDEFAGRWAMESREGKVFWLEVTGEQPVEGVFFGVTGGRLEKLRDGDVVDGALRFRVQRDRTAERQPPMTGTVALRRAGAGVEGTVEERGRKHVVRGWRPAEITDADDGSWVGAPAVRLDGFAPFREYAGRDKEWAYEVGVLRNLRPDAKLLVTRESYWNYVLRLEYRLPLGGNAGIGLRHHYELQLADDYGMRPDVHGNVSLYSQIAPRVNASRRAGEWQELELRLVGRELTVTLNGVRVMERARIRGLTGLALDADESKPGPLALQGDHGGVEYRNVVVTPLERGAR